MGTGMGKADITLSGGNVAGSLQGTGGSVGVTGSASQSGNTWTITEKSFPKGRVKIVLINEELGL